jgi:hypothetical protein
MAVDRTPIDISDMPDLRRIAEEVQATGQPRLLRRDGQDVALVTPLVPRNQHSASGRRRGRLTRDDALFDLIGAAAGPDDGVTDVSENKYHYLAEAYLPKPE